MQVIPVVTATVAVIGLLRMVISNIIGQTHRTLSLCVVIRHKNAREYSSVAPSKLWHPVFGPTLRRIDRQVGTLRGRNACVQVAQLR